MKIAITFIGLLLLITTSGYCAEKSPKVVKDSDNWYSSSTYSTDRTHYHVDAITQMCFIAFDSTGSMAYTVIPCSNLKKRPEWKDIITW